MAKRKRLTFDPVPAENEPRSEDTGGYAAEAGPLEVKAFLRPHGAPPSIAQVAADASAQAALSELSGVLAAAKAYSQSRNLGT